MSRKKAYRMIKKSNKMYICKQKEIIPLLKFYVPFISVFQQVATFILLCRVRGWK